MHKRRAPETDEENLDALKDLKALADTAGGELLVSALTDDVVGILHTLGAQYRTLSHTEFIAHGAALGEKLSLIKTLVNAKREYEAMEKELVAETLRE